MRWGRCCLSCLGRPPFVEDTPAQLMFRHVNTEAPLLSDLATTVPPRLDGLLALMLAKGPATTRYDGSAVAVDARCVWNWPDADRLPVDKVGCSGEHGDERRDGRDAGRRAARTGRRAACCGIRAALDDTSARGIGVCVFEALEPLISMGLRDPLSSPVPRDSACRRCPNPRTCLLRRPAANAIVSVFTSAAAADVAVFATNCIGRTGSAIGPAGGRCRVTR